MFAGEVAGRVLVNRSADDENSAPIAVGNELGCDANGEASVRILSAGGATILQHTV